MNTDPRPGISFEFFPPRSESMEQRLWHTVDDLSPLAPDFVSVTYGAGGKTRDRTHAVVARLLHETDLTPAAHLTCVDATQQEVLSIAREYHELGVRRLVALRGDPPADTTRFEAHPEGFDCAATLVEGLRSIADFDISVAGYPETHPEAESPEADIRYLKRKVDAGANRVITQLFFDNELFLRFRDRATAAGIDVPIVPGILPITSFRATERFCRACGASLPEWLRSLFAGLDEDTRTGSMIGAHIAASQCENLLSEGVDQFHFYTLNRPDSAHAVCRMLGIRSSTDRSGSQTTNVA